MDYRTPAFQLFAKKRTYQIFFDETALIPKYWFLCKFWLLQSSDNSAIPMWFYQSSIAPLDLFPFLQYHLLYSKVITAARRCSTLDIK